MRYVVFVIQFAIVLAATTRAMAAGEEEFGNQPLHEANYTDYPNLLPLLNLDTRVYRQWVNGNESCFFQGDAAAINEALARFAAVKQPAHEVVLRPGPGEVSSFDGSREISFGFKVQWLGGIAGHLTTRDKGHLVWSRLPVLTLYVDDQTNLDQLVWPDDVRIVDTAELSVRCRQGLRSKDQTVRGWACGVLADIDPYNVENMAAIAQLLSDDENWVRQNAAGALAEYGAKASSYLPALQALAVADDERLSESAARAIETIRTAEDTSAEEGRHIEIQARIAECRQRLPD